MTQNTDRSECLSNKSVHADGSNRVKMSAKERLECPHDVEIIKVKGSMTYYICKRCSSVVGGQL